MHHLLKIAIFFVFCIHNLTAQVKITGVVQEILDGDDGYTAVIITQDKKTYNATVSIPNFEKNTDQYRRVSVGETITVESETDSKYLAVRSLSPKADNTKDKANNDNKAIKGIVKKIENGKDGYTAEIQTAKKEIYYVTISIANLDKGQNYRRVKIGEKVSLEGEFWTMGNQKRITVRKLKP